MPTITQPAATRPIAVQPRQPLAFGSDVATNWWKRNQTTGEAWTQFNAGGTTATVVWETPATVSRRLTFDRVQVFASDTQPAVGETGGLRLNLCEGPPAVLWGTQAIRNEAMEEPPLRPWDGEDDDPPLGVPFSPLAPASRDRFGTVLQETASEPGGPASLVALYGPGLFVDTAGKVGSRTPFTTDVRGLGPFPAVASYHHGGLYFQHDFGKSRTLGLTRVLYEDANLHVAVVRGDGRRNTYRWTGSAFEAAVGVRNTLTKVSGIFEETTPSGRIYRYLSTGKLDRVVDRAGNPAYYTYDVNGRLQKVQGLSGALGLVPYLSYDLTGLLTRLVLQDPLAAANNRTSYFSYDANRNLTRIIGPENCITYFGYSANGLYLTSVTDPDGYVWRANYDANNRVDRVVDALNVTAYYAHNTATPLVTQKDRAGKATYFQFNAFGSPERVFNVGTPADYYAFDGEGNLTAAKNRQGQEWTYEYDGRSNRIASTDPLGARSYFAYDGQDLLRTYVDPIARSTYLDYDGARNRTKWIDPIGNAAYYEYESTGLLRDKKDRRGAFTYFVWDARGNPSKINDPLGQATYFAHNSAGEQTARIDPLGRLSYFDRDKRGRVTKQVNPIGAATYLAYDSRCNLVSEKNARLNTTLHVYDGNSNRIKTTDPLGNAIYYGYDPEERLSSQKNARLFATTWTYDALGRRQKQIDALGYETYLAYDDAHQLERQVDARGHATYFTYDAAGRLTRQKDALDQETYFGFDPAGQRVLTTDARDESTTFEYDPRGWQRRTESAVGAVTYVAFDEEGNRLRSVDPRGNTTYFTYDVAGRPTHTTDQLLGVTYTGYDRASQTVLRTDQVGAPTYMSYDGAGRQQTTLDAAGLLTYHAYDLVDSLLQSNVDQGWGNSPFGASPYGGERATTYHTYDAANRRQRSTDPYGGVTYVAYDRTSNVDFSVNPRGFGTYFTYDALNRQTHVKDGVLFASTYMGYDPVGNVVRQVDQQGVTTYSTYDRLNRVEFRHDPAGALSYFVFDPVGNQIETHVLLGAGGEQRSTYSQYDAVNRTVRQVAADGGETYFEYDLAGNQTRTVDPEGRPTYLTYDELNRQVTRDNALGNRWTTTYDERSSVLRQIDPEGRTAYMGYDLAGRRLHQSNALGELSYFFHDARGQRTHVINPRGYSTYFRFDLLGRQSRRQDALGGLTYMGYDSVGNLVVQAGPEESSLDRLYYYDSTNTRIERIALDGTDRTVLVSNPAVAPVRVGLDLLTPGGKLYWIGVNGGYRANLDGSNVEQVLDASDVGTPGAFVVDADGGRLYFSSYDGANTELRSTTLAGGDLQTVLNVGAWFVRGLAFDPVERKLYYSRTVYPTGGTLRRVNVDGTGDTALTGPAGFPVGVALDLFARKVYWADEDASNVQKANLDGTSPTTVVSVSSPAEVSVDPLGRRLYWSTFNTVVSANLDGTSPQTLLSQTAPFSVPIALRLNLLAYDGLNRTSTSQDAHFATTYLGYDSRSSAVLRVDADGRATYMAYDPARRLERQWFANPVAGETADSPIYYVYDQVGNLLTSDDSLAGLGVSVFEYDELDRVTKKATLAGPVYYGYDLSGMKTEVKDPNLEAVGSAYDAAGRLIRTTVVASPNRESYYHYDDAGLIEKKVLSGNRVLSYYSYDQAGRLSQLVNLDSTASLLTYFAYQRNPNGAVTRINHEGNEWTYFTYDALDRLIEERRTQNPTIYGFQYEYDAASNRTRKLDVVQEEITSYTVDALGLIGSETTGGVATAYSYDQSQRMESRYSSAQATYFSHNQRDLPTKLEFAVSAGTPDDTREFKYTGTGERAVIVGEWGAGYETRLAYDGTRVLTEKDTFGNTYGQYRWGSPQHGGALAESANPAESATLEGPVMDERGSVDKLAGVTGRVIYDRFGVELANNLASTTRTRFVASAFLRLGTSGQLSLTPGGLYLPSIAALLGQVEGGGGVHHLSRAFFTSPFVSSVRPKSVLTSTILADVGFDFPTPTAPPKTGPTTAPRVPGLKTIPGPWLAIFLGIEIGQRLGACCKYFLTTSMTPLENVVVMGGQAGQIAEIIINIDLIASNNNQLPTIPPIRQNFNRHYTRLATRWYFEVDFPIFGKTCLGPTSIVLPSRQVSTYMDTRLRPGRNNEFFVSEWTNESTGAYNGPPFIAFGGPVTLPPATAFEVMVQSSTLCRDYDYPPGLLALFSPDPPGPFMNPVRQ